MKNIFIYSLLLLFPLFSCEKEEAAQADDEQEAGLLGDAAYPLESTDDLDVLIKDIGEARYVLLGEASHGTSEYYTWRAEISKRLIEEKGFDIIAVEGDWPDLYRLNQYIRGSSENGASAEEVLGKLNRWPTWMWANEEVADFGEWIRTHNQEQSQGQQVGFYGLDVYSFWNSMEEVITYLENTNPDAAERAREAYNCLEPFMQDEWTYAQAKASGEVDCADELSSVLEMVEQQMSNAPQDDEAAFNAFQNALVAVNAERYYATAVKSNAESWNIRDRHMMQTINNLTEQYGEDSKIIIWEHNTHVGDARATSMANAGMVNVGQLVREEHGEEGVYIVGFGSYSGTVMAASSWGVERKVMNVPNARPGSWEALLHAEDPADKIIFLEELEDKAPFNEVLGHRAIGVVYNPNAEEGNYVPSILPERYDAFIFIDHTHALTPIPTGTPDARLRSELTEGDPVSQLIRNY